MTTTLPPDTVRRFERRQWHRRARAARPWLIVAGCLVLLGFAGWVVFVSSWLGVRTVEVESPGVDPALVRSAVHVSAGTPLARVDISAVRDRVDAIPAVASAAVSRHWPHTLVVQVVARRAVGDVQVSGAWWQIDRTGVLFDKATVAKAGEPAIELDGLPGVQVRTEVAAVLGSLTPALHADTVRVTADSVDSITLVLKGGSQVRWGTPDQSALKAEVLSALMAHHHATLYDVSIPSQPAVRG